MSARDRRKRERPSLESRVLRYLRTHPEGLSTSQIYAWIQSCRVGGGYTLQEFDLKLTELRKASTVAHANGLWYLPKVVVREEPKQVRTDSGPLFEPEGWAGPGYGCGGSNEDRGRGTR